MCAAVAVCLPPHIGAGLAERVRSHIGPEHNSVRVSMKCSGQVAESMADGLNRSIDAAGRHDASFEEHVFREQDGTTVAVALDNRKMVWQKHTSEVVIPAAPVMGKTKNRVNHNVPKSISVTLEELEPLHELQAVPRRFSATRFVHMRQWDVGAGFFYRITHATPFGDTACMDAAIKDAHRQEHTVSVDTLLEDGDPPEAVFNAAMNCIHLLQQLFNPCLGVRIEHA